MTDPTAPPAHVIYCTRCGQAMSVAAEHVHMAVACPHCNEAVEPWRAASGPPPVPAAERMREIVWGTGERGASRCHRVVAGVLGICLGSVGAHRFYLGYMGVGVVQLLLCWTGISAVWGIIEGVLCLTGHMRDADGLPLRE